MKKYSKGLKLTAAMLVVTMFSAGSLSLPSIAFAAKAQVETGTWKPVSLGKSIDDNSIVVSSIPKDNAFVPKGVKIDVEVTKEIHSKHVKTGDQLVFNLLDNIIINDVVVVPAGSEVMGVVTAARKAGGLGRSGKLEFTINSVKALNGVEIPLEYVSSQKGATDGGAAAVFVFASMLGGLFMKGKNVSVPAGTKLSAVVANDTDLNVKLSDLATVMDSRKSRGVIIKQ